MLVYIALLGSMHINCLQSMYQGVLKDDERRLAKMKQRQQDFDESKRKRELYERVQTVQGTGNSDSS